MHANGVQKLGVLKTETIKHRAGVAWYTFFFSFLHYLFTFLFGWNIFSRQPLCASKQLGK